MASWTYLESGENASAVTWRFRVPLMTATASPVAMSQMCTAGSARRPRESMEAFPPVSDKHGERRTENSCGTTRTRCCESAGAVHGEAHDVVHVALVEALGAVFGVGDHADGSRGIHQLACTTPQAHAALG